MSEVEKMNEAMYERLGEIAKKCCAMRVECDAKAIEDEAERTNIRLLGAFADLRQMCEFYKPAAEPIVPGCPSSMPRQLPGGFDGTEEIREDSPDSRSEANAKKDAEYFRRKYSFCDGLFPIHFVNTEDGQMASCWIGGRHFTLKLDHYDGKCTAVVKDNGKAVFSLYVMRGKSISGHVAYAAFKEYVRNISGSGKYHSRGGFLKQAEMKQQAHGNKQEVK